MEVEISQETCAQLLLSIITDQDSYRDYLIFLYDLIDRRNHAEIARIMEVSHGTVQAAIKRVYSDILMRAYECNLHLTIADINAFVEQHKSKLPGVMRKEIFVVDGSK